MAIGEYEHPDGRKVYTGDIGNISTDSFYFPRMSDSPRGWTSDSVYERLSRAGIELVIGEAEPSETATAEELAARGIISVRRADGLRSDPSFNL